MTIRRLRIHLRRLVYVSALISNLVSKKSTFWCRCDEHYYNIDDGFRGCRYSFANVNLFVHPFECALGLRGAHVTARSRLGDLDAFP